MLQARPSHNLDNCEVTKNIFTNQKHFKEHSENLAKISDGDPEVDSSGEASEPVRQLDHVSSTDVPSSCSRCGPTDEINSAKKLAEADRRKQPSHQLSRTKPDIHSGQGPSSSGQSPQSSGQGPQSDWARPL